jgi:predicted metal-binding membrane protein
VTHVDRIAILSALAAATALAWWYTAAMPGMGDMSSLHPWTARDAAIAFAMWAIMMVGMMLPSATPMTLIYAQVVRKAARDGSVLPPTAVFVAGYLAAWTLFSAAATAAQWALERAALLSPMLVSTSPRLGAGLLVAAGVWQLTPWKNACLSHCRSPVHYFAQNFRPGVRGALRLGFRYGLYCLGCCWLIMALLFVGGVMNLFWIAALTIFVLAEKAFARGPWGSRVAGLAMIAAGAGLFARS